MSSDAVHNLDPVRRLRRFSGDELVDDSCAFSSDHPLAERAFSESNAEKNRVYPMDMRDFRRLVDVPMPTFQRRRDRVRRGEDVNVVYFVQSAEGGPVKIGTSTVGALLNRFSAIQVANPSELVIRRLVAGDWRLERGLHSYFDAQRTRRRGEWFHPTAELEEIVTGGKSGQAENRTPDTAR